MNTVLFYIIIFLTNVIQGITGFAGTILAMPPSLILVGYDVAKPILNVLGILAGVYVFVTQWKHVDWKQLEKGSHCHGYRNLWRLFSKERTCRI